MKNKKLKKLSLINLIMGYATMSLFLFLILLNLNSFKPTEEVVVITMDPVNADYIDLFDGTVEDDVVKLREERPVDVDPEGREIVYVDREFVRDFDVGLNHGDNLLINNRLDTSLIVDRVASVNRHIIHEKNFEDRGRFLNNNVLHGGINDSVYVDNDSLSINNGNGFRVGLNENIDAGILDRRLYNLKKENNTESALVIEDEYGLDGDEANLLNMSLDEGESELGDILADFEGGNPGSDGRGVDKGKLYAYNYPSQGVGAGIGNAGVGAAAGFAGIGAGIGEAVLDGKAVPALGGIGSYSSVKPTVATGLDSDGDGVSDSLESYFRTNPKSNDTDKDGISDSEEIRGLSNPLVASSKPGSPAPGGDEDEDGVPSSLESLYGLSPTNEDTDGDGFNDGEELVALTNPRDPNSNPGESGGPALSLAPGVAGGVAGLVNGAGAGVAAGLMPNKVEHPLGLGVECEGCKDEGCSDCVSLGGGKGLDKGAYWKELPVDGNLFIMMYVDESGSILSTRKALVEMRDGIMKEALLPYYMNDENLYNRRVQVVGSKEIGTPGIAEDGERSLEFFAAAAKKKNVLALAFQDEGAPSYHLPNFNKNPEKHYLNDLGVLRNRLDDFGGVYRGVMFQVDRGKTFAKSFKEFVESAWQGENYLSGKGHSLKPFYWQENRHHIRNHDGIVFSDEYHVQSDSNPQYYLDLIFKASKKIGLDLNVYAGGLKDGKNIKN